MSNMHLLLSFAFVVSLAITKATAELKGINPEAESGAYQGDILLPPGSGFRNALSRARKWTNGVVPYDTSAMSDRAKPRIKAALKELQDAVGGTSCITFKERTNENNYVRILNGVGCNSYVGMFNGGQIMNLSENGCLSYGTIQHEFLHAMGFMHEQCRSDRDKYIRILWNNVTPKWKYAFDKSKTDNQNLPYDYLSVMQYGRTAFSKNGKPTMELLDGTEIPYRNNKLTKRDIKMVQLFYGCSTGNGNGNGGDGNGNGNGGDGNGGGSENNCIDKDDNCSFWSTKYCTDPTYKEYMTRNCPKSCKLCGSGGGTQTCKDNDKNCGGWLTYCKNNEYVKETCKKTCGTC